MKLSLTKETVAICLALLLVGSAIGAFAASDTYPIGGGAVMGPSADGPETTLAGDFDLASGNPFPDDNTFDMQPYGTLESQGWTAVTIESFDQDDIELTG